MQQSRLHHSVFKNIYKINLTANSSFASTTAKFFSPKPYHMPWTVHDVMFGNRLQEALGLWARWWIQLVMGHCWVKMITSQSTLPQEALKRKRGSIFFPHLFFCWKPSCKTDEIDLKKNDFTKRICIFCWWAISILTLKFCAQDHCLLNDATRFQNGKDP